MTTPHRSRLSTLVLAVTSCATLAAGALGLSACASDASAPSAGFDRDGGVDAPSTGMQCRRTEDCPAHNDVCVFTSGSILGVCGPPPDEGRCDPDEGALDAPGCYPGARCQPVPRERSAAGGLCSFQAPQAPVFTSPVALPKISVTAPGALTVLRPTDGVQLRWTPPALPPDAVVVAVVLARPPQRAGAANRIANPADVVWAWASTDPGASTTPGAVALEAGHRGVTASGELGPRYAGNLLPAGRYWWFVFAQRAGVVVAASDVLSFRVGRDFASVACATVDDCTRLIPGELPDTVGCVEGACRRRCASDFDCPGVGGRCELTVTVSADARRGAFCTPVTP